MPVYSLIYMYDNMMCASKMLTVWSLESSLESGVKSEVRSQAWSLELSQELGVKSGVRSQVRSQKSSHCDFIGKLVIAKPLPLP